MAIFDGSFLRTAQHVQMRGHLSNKTGVPPFYSILAGKRLRGEQVISQISASQAGQRITRREYKSAKSVE